MSDHRIGAGIAGAMLLGISVIELFWGAAAPAAANALTAVLGLVLLGFGLRTD
jgi:hypothetical protein